MKLTDFKVLTFDCYGTLIDWESGIWDALQALLMANGRQDITRGTALEAFAAREGEQMEAAVWKSMNLTPSAASRSIWGVFTFVAP